MQSIGRERQNERHTLGTAKVCRTYSEFLPAGARRYDSAWS